MRGRVEQCVCVVEEMAEVQQLQMVRYCFQFSTRSYNPTNQPTHTSERISFLAVTRIILLQDMKYETVQFYLKTQFNKNFAQVSSTP